MHSFCSRKPKYISCNVKVRNNNNVVYGVGDDKEKDKYFISKKH